MIMFAAFLCNGRVCLSQAAKQAGPAKDITVESELTTKDIRTDESNLANIVLDAIRSSASADGAIMHASAFSSITIQGGKTNVAEISKAVQFKEDTISIVNLTGAQLKKAFENALKLLPQKSPEFLQVSNIVVEYAQDKPQDKRVVSITVARKPITDMGTYSIAMPTVLAHGALGYYKIWDGTKDVTETQTDIASALTSYLATNKSLSGKGEGRIVSKK